MQSSPVIDGGIVYVGSDDSSLYAIAERPPRVRKPVEIEAKLLDDYAGDYQAGSLKGAIKNQKGQLVLDLGPMGAPPLTPMSATRFFFDPADVEVEFQRGSTGKVTGFRLWQSEFEVQFQRVPPSSPR